MNRFVEMLKTRPMTLIMSLPANDPALAKAAFDAGADVVKVHCNVRHRASGTGFGPLAEYADTFAQMFAESKGPMGLVPGAGIEDVLRDMHAASAMGFDFFSLYAHHAPPAILSLSQALMAACAHDYAPGEAAGLQAAGAQVLEASVIPPDGYGQPLSLRDVMAYRRLCEASRLPVVVPTQRHIRPEELPYLRDAGVKGIMIGAIVTGKTKDGITHAVEAFRSAIDRLEG